MDFYDTVLRQLVVALGAAMFLGNLVALARRRRDAQPAPRAGRRSSKAKGASRVAPGRAATGELVQAPVARTLAYATLGFVMMVAGMAALAAS